MKRVLGVVCGVVCGGVCGVEVLVLVLDRGKFFPKDENL